MTARAKKKPGPEIASERIEIRVTPSQLAAWTAGAKERHLTLKAVIVEAMDGYLDVHDEGELADLGREVLDLVRDRFPAA